MRWEGHFRVVWKRNDLDYEVTREDKAKLFHINLLKRYEERQSERPEAEIACRSSVEEKGNQRVEDVSTLPLSKEQSTDEVVINTELNEEKSVEITRFIKEYEDIFSELPGKANLNTCDLRCSSNQPVHANHFLLPFAGHEDI